MELFNLQRAVAAGAKNLIVVEAIWIACGFIRRIPVGGGPDGVVSFGGTGITLAASL
jgi:hypothetical protein